MVSVKVAPRIDRNKQTKFAKGDVYTIDNTITRQDVDKDRVKDLIVDHVVRRNRKLFYTSRSTWYGVDDETYDLFVKNIAPALDDFTTDNFAVLVEYWKKLSGLNDVILQYGTGIANTLSSGEQSI